MNDLARRVCAVAVLVGAVGCDKSSSSKPSDASATAATPAATTAAPTATDAPTEEAPAAAVTTAPRPPAPPPPTLGLAPLEQVCLSKPDAASRAKGPVPDTDTWKRYLTVTDKFALSYPPSVFTVKQETPYLELVSRVSAKDGKGGERPFAIRVQRIASPVNEVLAHPEKSPLLARAELDTVFPNRTAESFTPNLTERFVKPQPGMTGDITIPGSPPQTRARWWVTGKDGYNTDHVLVSPVAGGTLVVEADWNSDVISGQPECWERQIIADLLYSMSVTLPAPGCLELDEPAELEGKISVGENINGRSEVEKPYILVLDKPTCFGRGKPQREVHLAPMSDEAGVSAKALKGKHVQAVGSPFAAHTAHHARPIVLGAKSVRPL